MNLNKIKKILFIIILCGLIIFLGIILETYLAKKGINQFIKDNHYKPGIYNIYTLTEKESNNETTYQILYDNYYFTKYSITKTNDETLKINYYYNAKNEIIVEYEYSYIKENEFKIDSLKATYKNNKLKECEIIVGDLNNCDSLNDFANNYKNEIDIILDNYNINTRFLKIEHQNYE